MVPRAHGCPPYLATRWSSTALGPGKRVLRILALPDRSGKSLRSCPTLQLLDGLRERGAVGVDEIGVGADVLGEGYGGRTWGRFAPKKREGGGVITIGSGGSRR